MQYFIITSAGGEGHLTLAKAQRDYLQETQPNATIEIIDLMGVDKSITTQRFKNISWVPNFSIPLTNITFFSGETNVNRWNLTQRRGGMNSVKHLEQLIEYQSLAETIQSNTIYKNLKAVLQQNPDLKEIIDTQALSTPEICYAVTEENLRREQTGYPQIKVRKIISEFLTDKTIHFLRPLSRVKNQDSECLTVEVVNHPLRTENESYEEFYQRNNVAHIRFKVVKPPVRKEFLKDHTKKQAIYIQTTNNTSCDLLKEQNFIRETLDEDLLEDNNYFKIIKNNNDKFYTITLGSQSSTTILRYIDRFIDEVIKYPIQDNNKIILFITAGKNDGSFNTTYALTRRYLETKITELQALNIPWPKCAKIIPLSFQNDKCMASLFQNSDLVITRSGGMSSIEIFKTSIFNSKRKVLIHSEEIINPETINIFNFDICYQELLPGTISWEAGNAQYLIYNVQACLTSPECIVFNIQGNTKTQTYQNSLLYLATTGKLNTENQYQIKELLKIGSDPNLLMFNGLPVIAFTKDIKILKLFIKFGGRLTKEVLDKLAITFTMEQLKDVQNLENKIQTQIKYFGCPHFIKKLWNLAANNNEVDTIRGLLHRFPRMNNTELDELLTNNHNIEMINAVKLAKGNTLLRTELETHNITDENRLYFKRLIYINRNQLDKINNAIMSPLLVCNDKELQTLMVKLGANPKYLQNSIDESEYQNLLNEYQHSKYIKVKFKNFLLETYKSSANNEDEFCKLLISYFEQNFPQHDNNANIAIAKNIFASLNNAKNEINRMTIIDYIIDNIKYLFGLDLMSITLSDETNKMLCM